MSMKYYKQWNYKLFIQNAELLNPVIIDLCETPSSDFVTSKISSSALTSYISGGKTSLPTNPEIPSDSIDAEERKDDTDDRRVHETNISNATNIAAKQLQCVMDQIRMLHESFTLIRENEDRLRERTDELTQCCIDGERKLLQCVEEKKRG